MNRPWGHSEVCWPRATRIVRSAHPPIDLFEDIADPADWETIISAEQKTNPRLAVSLGRLDLVPVDRRVSGPGASFLMAPFTHASPDRPSRFSSGQRGVLYAGDRFQVALAETIYHHGRFMRATGQVPGWTSQFRELRLRIEARLVDLRSQPKRYAACLDPDDYGPAQALGESLRNAGENGVTYPSVRHHGGDCVGLFHPDLASNVTQARHLDYHWDGHRVDYYRDNGSRQVVSVPAE